VFALDSSSKRTSGTTVNLRRSRIHRSPPGIIQPFTKVHDTTKPVVFGALRYAQAPRCHELLPSKFAPALKNDACDRSGDSDSGARCRHRSRSPLDCIDARCKSSSRRHLKSALKNSKKSANAVPIANRRSMGRVGTKSSSGGRLVGEAKARIFERSRARLPGGRFPRWRARGVPPAVVARIYHLCSGGSGQQH